MSKPPGPLRPSPPTNQAAPNQAAPNQAALAGADPRFKVLALTAWSFLLALAPGLEAALAGLLGSAIFAALSGQRPAMVMKRLLAVNIFIFFFWLTLPFSYPGEAIARLGPLTATRPGLELAGLLTIKGNAVALGAIAFFGTAQVFELAAAAGRLGAPEKLIALFVLMFRYVKLIGLESARLRLAMKIRGFRPAVTAHTYRSYAHLIGMLLVRSLERAVRIHAAMRCRGYDGRFPLAGDFRFRRPDWALTALTLALSALVFYLAFLFG